MSENNFVLVAIQAEIHKTEKRLAVLHNMERQAEQLDGSPSRANGPTKPPAERKAKPGKPKGKRQPPITVEDALPGVRDALQDGPLSLQAIHTAIGRSRNHRTETIIGEALERLGAVQVDRLWSLNGNGHVPAEPAPRIDTQSVSNSGLNPNRVETPEAEQDAEIDEAYMQRRLLGALQVKPMTAADAADAIDAPERMVAIACGRLTESGELSRMTDGRYVG